MGTARSGRGDPVGSGSLTVPAARVVPNIPSFAVDAGFWYSIPEHLRSDLRVGSIVRVPLSGRRVRGWVVEVGERPQAKLKDVLGISGSSPVFDAGLERSLKWAAQHYVAPFSVVLAKATPPNLPGDPGGKPVEPIPDTRSEHPLTGFARSTADGRRMPPLAMIGRWQDLEWVESLAPVLEQAGSVLILAATGTEVSAISTRAEVVFGSRVIAVFPDDDAAVTRAWDRARHRGVILVGTQRVASWGIAGLGLAVVVEEGRRAMKDRQTPTIHVREMIRTRARIEGFNPVFFGPTPSVELLAAGAATMAVGRRAWGLVEVVDRSGDKPGSGMISEVVVAALRAVAVDAGERAFLLTGHKMAPVVVDEVNQRLGAGAAALYPAPAFVSVGTERDLAGIDPISLAVAVDVDFMVSGSGYRGSEEALRQLARLGNTLRPGRGRRMMVQTTDPRSDLVETLRRGDPIPYLERVLLERARLGLPPAKEMIAIEVRGESPEGVEEAIATLQPVEIHGPMPIETGRRWLVAGDLTKVRPALRALAATWREKGATVRIDADPIDF